MTHRTTPHRESKNKASTPITHQSHVRHLFSASRALLWSSVSLIAIVGALQRAQADCADPNSTNCTQQSAGGATPIPDINVNAPTVQPNDGSAAAGYRQESVYGGIGSFWGDLPTQDVPYSVQTTPHELIDNLTSVTNLQDALRYNPDLQYGAGGGFGFTSTGIQYVVRGVVVFNPALTTDNMYSPYGFLAGTEDKESVNVLTGVSGFLYGVQNVSGHIDSELKRPTATPLFDVIAGTNTGHNGYVHADLGGPLEFAGIDPGIFGYRLNLADQGGGTYLHGDTISRNLFSLALDAHLPDNLLVQLNASHQQMREWGGARFYETNDLVNPPNPDQQYVSPTKSFAQDDTGGIKITWKPSDIFTVRSQYSYDIVRNGTGQYEPGSDYWGSSIAPTTIYPSLFASGSTSEQYTHAGYTYLDTSFDISDTHHKITTGFNGYWTENNRGTGDWAQTFYQQTGLTCSLYNEAACLAQAPLNPNPILFSNLFGGVQNVTRQKNYMLGDEMKALDDRLIVLAGLNYASTGAISYTTVTPSIATNRLGTKQFLIGTITPSKGSNNAAAVTPTASITYKLLPWFSAYTSFQQSLVPGSFVPDVGVNNMPYTNAGALIPPSESSAWEGGLKATVGNNLLLTMAIFDLKNPVTYTVDNGDGTLTEKYGGASETHGIEFKAVGKLTNDLAIFGGVSLNNARYLRLQGAESIAGGLVPFQAPVTGTIYAEYTLPFFAEAPWLHNLTLTGGFRYFGPSKTNAPGTDISNDASFSNVSQQGYALGDLGFRFVYDLYGHPTTFRFTVTNVTNHAYWYAGQNLGQGRVFAATTEFKWSEPAAKVDDDPFPVDAAPVDWSGIYAGVQGGYQWTATSGGAPYSLTGVPAYTTNFNQAGLIGGAHIGYNYALDHVILGIEGDVEASSFYGSGPYQLNFSTPGPTGNGLTGNENFVTTINFESSIRGRLGYAWDRFMLYGTGGLAFASVENSYQSFVGGGLDVISGMRKGWTLGGGFEYFFRPNWSLSGEYRYTDLGSENDILAASNAGQIGDHRHETLNTVRFGVSYHFNSFTPPAPSEVAVAVLPSALSAYITDQHSAPASNAKSPEPAVNWTGAYLGGRVGYQWSTSLSGEPYLTATKSLTYASIYNYQGVIGGALAGYNYQFDHLLLGVEGDAERSNTYGTGPFGDQALVSYRFATNINFQASARGRIGFVWDRMLLYGTGGLAFGSVRDIYVNSGVPAQSTDDITVHRVGYTFGGGFEYFIKPEWSVRSEYRYTDLGHYDDILIVSSGGVLGDHRHPTMSTASFGVAYHFSMLNGVTPFAAR